MSPLPRHFIPFWFGVLACSLLAAPVARSAEKFALLIGVTRYNDARLNRGGLEYPEADATSVADVLRRGGYTVVLLLGKDSVEGRLKGA